MNAPWLQLAILCGAVSWLRCEVVGPVITTTPEPAVLRRRRSIDVMGKMSPSQFTDAMIDAMLKAHNDYRRSEPGADIKEIPYQRTMRDYMLQKWSKKLADMAQAGADYCVFTHINFKLDSSTTYGQNIVMFATDIRKKVERGAYAWYKERADFDMTSNKCAEGKVCGHYLQLVLSSVSEVGCGIKNCAKVAMPDKDWINSWVVFCNYNRIRHKGSKPYTEGKACSKCRVSPGWKCVNNLCARCDPATDSACTPYTCWKDPEIKDKYSAKKCAKYAKRKYCTKKAHIMSIVCPRTCKICPAWLKKKM